MSISQGEGLAQQPYWARPEPLPGVALPTTADIVIVGGGITGAALLYWLRLGESRVLLLERSHLAAGASGRNAGFLLAGVAANYAAACKVYGRARASEVWSFTQDNHERFVEAFAGADVGYARLGSATLAADPVEADELADSAELLREDGYAVELMRRGDDAILFNAGDGQVNPAKAVARLVERRGRAIVVEGSAVLGFEPGSGFVRVHTDRGEVRATRLVLATNGYTSRLARIPILAKRAQMLATAPTGSVVAEQPVYSDRGYRYWRQLSGGSVLLGGFRNEAFEAEVGDDDRPTLEIQGHLDRHLVEMQIRAAVTHRWAGTMGFTPDELPLVGPVPGMAGVFVCGVYSGHGMGFAVNCARVLVDSWNGGTIPRWLQSGRFAE